MMMMKPLHDLTMTHPLSLDEDSNLEMQLPREIECEMLRESPKMFSRDLFLSISNSTALDTSAKNHYPAIKNVIIGAQ